MSNRRKAQPKKVDCIVCSLGLILCECEHDWTCHPTAADGSEPCSHCACKNMSVESHSNTPDGLDEVAPFIVQLSAQIDACNDILNSLPKEVQEKLRSSKDPRMYTGYVMGQHDALYAVREALPQALRNKPITLN